MTLFVADDAVARGFEPFALTRPASELRAGAELIRRRWELSLGETAAGLVAADHLADFEEPGAPPVRQGELPAGSVVASSRFAPSLAPAVSGAEVWRCEGRVAAIRLGRSIPAARLAAVESLDELAGAQTRSVEIDGWWLDQVWDLVRHLPAMLTRDILALAAGGERAAVEQSPGAQPVYIEPGAQIEPMVALDASAGPILVRRGATVCSFTRLVGPCVIGEGTSVSGGRVAACSIGERCRVNGELSTSVFIGHANKSHDGFIGHSVVGRWVNLGASTVNSNLKNTYGTVSLWTPGGMRDTGEQFLGTLFGDHVKTAIGTRLTTGCVIGAGANVFGDRTTPKVIAPFAWGVERGETWSLDRFLATAERVMARRQVALGAGARRQLAAAYERRWRGPA
jgi:UDP-N-acetylglucosamine diphosphorylase/glucosamine-1-phosphate N-acetyltransferase